MYFGINTSYKNVMSKINVLVIGNGFDIHHEMKTKYTDFLDFTKDYRAGNVVYIQDLEKPMRLIKTNDFISFFINYSEKIEGWIDFETLIKEVIEFIELYIVKLDETKGVNVGGIRYDYALQCNDALGRMIANSFNKLFRIDTHRHLIILKEEYRSELYTVNKDKIVNLLRTELDDLRNIMAIYFKYYEITRREDYYQDEIRYKQIMDMQIDKVISFNYTNTYERYGISEEDVTHIHGKAMELYVRQEDTNYEVGLNSIVLGFQDDNEESLDFVYFKKYFQCLYFNTDLIDKDCFSRSKRKVGEDAKSPFRQKIVIVHILGHSLDETDKEKLIPIFHNADKVKIYCRNVKDFETKVIKVIKLLGKEKAVAQIHDETISFIEISKTLYDGSDEPEEERNILHDKIRPYIRKNV